eukprot:3915229-Karenia_brevis.AAC.1
MGLQPLSEKQAFGLIVLHDLYHTLRNAQRPLSQQCLDRPQKLRYSSGRYTNAFCESITEDL